MPEEEYIMVEECTDSYLVEERADGGVTITLVVPRRFADLWVTRLSELKTTDAEIAQHEP